MIENIQHLGVEAEKPFALTIVENVGGQEDVPMHTTADDDVQKLAVIAAAKAMGSLSVQPFSIELVEGSEDEGLTDETPEDEGPIDYCADYLAHFKSKGLNFDDDVRFSISEVNDALIYLQVEEINFENVFEILLYRFSLDYAHYFGDKEVAILVKLLLDGHKIDSILKHINQPIDSDSLPNGSDRLTDIDFA